MFSTQKKYSIIVATLLLFLFGASSPSSALILLSSRPAGVVIDFTSFSDGSVISNPFSLAYSGGTATFSQTPGSSFVRRTQFVSWFGDFAPGDALLYTDGNHGPMDIVFSGGVTAFGTQIQPFFLRSGNAIIEAFDAGGSSLGSFTVPSLSTTENDNSATFIGVANSGGENAIARINLSINGFKNGQDFAINRVSFTAAAAAPVPEPSTLALLGMGLLGMFGYGRHRKKR